MSGKRRFFMWICAFFGLGLAGCHRPAPPSPVQDIAADAPQAQRGAKEIRPGIWRYTTRGRVERLPKATGIARDLAIHHEALTAFHDRQGKDVGMDVMVMDFPAIASGVSLQGLFVGDVIVFDFDVDWSSPDVWTLTRVNRLPENTPLDLRPKGAAAEAPK